MESAPTKPMQPLQRRSLAEQVAEAIDDFIAANGLVAGDKLMSERELATSLGVSRSLVREAVSALRERGSIEARHGKGLFLSSPKSAQATLVTIDPAQALLNLPYIWEMRQALETQCARLAALRAAENDVQRMEASLRQMEAEIEDGNPGLVGDQLFHAAVAQASYNPILIELLRGVSDALALTSARSLHHHGQPARSLSDHRLILEAIRAHEPSDAADAMLSHLVSTTDLLIPQGRSDQAEVRVALGGLPNKFLGTAS